MHNHDGASDTDRARTGITHAGLHVASNFKTIENTVGLECLTKLAGGMNDRRTSGMQGGLRRLARRLAGRENVTMREELEAVIAGQPTTTKHSKQRGAATTRLGWLSDEHKVDTKLTLYAAAYMGVAAAVDVLLVATALGSLSDAGGGFVEERIGALSADALEAVAKRTGGKQAHGDERDAVADGDEDVAERMMRVVRWRSQQQQQQQAHEQADGPAVAAATDRAALLWALCVAAKRGNEATALRLMVVVDVATQQLEGNAAAAGDDLASGLATTIDGMDDDEKTRDAAESLISDVVAHGTLNVLDALLDRLLGGESDDGRSVWLLQRVVGTAMYYAGQHGRVDVITQLLQRLVMSSVDVRNSAYDGMESSKERAGWTALHAAADAGQLECVRVLLRYGADVNAVVVPQRADGGYVERIGWNAFGISAAGQHGDVMDELLVVSGVRVVGLKDDDEAAAAAAWWTALHMAVMRQRTADVATALTAATAAAGGAANGGGGGVDVCVRRGWAAGYTALHIAAAVGGEAEVRQLVAAGADVGARVGGEDEGRTALSVAARYGRVGVLRVLVELGVDVNVRGGETALTAAATFGREAAVAVLLDMGAAIDQLDGSGDSALHRAIWKRRDAVVRLLIARRADVNVRSRQGYTPLAEAARYGNVTGVAMLCAAGADVNSSKGKGRSKGTGWTPLMHAVMNGHVEVVCELLRRGADATACDRDGDDALELAKQSDCWDVVSVLAAHLQQQ